MKKKHKFNTENAQSRRLKRRKTPNYRVINKYSKSTQQYWKERHRRKQVLQLYQEGKSTREIAKALGICSRTVTRDMKKLNSYLKGQINRKRHLLDQERRRELESLSAISLMERSKTLSCLLFHTKKLGQKEEFEQHNITIVLDMDNLTVDGFPNSLQRADRALSKHRIT